MSTSQPKPWDKAVAAQLEEEQLATWKAALVDAAGNIKKAAELAGIARSYAMTLNKKHGLQEFAAALRLAAGAVRVAAGARKGVVTGRPRKG